MHISIITDDVAKAEILAQGMPGDSSLEWISSPADVNNPDCCIDLLFDGSAERIALLNSSTAPLIIINAVLFSGQELPEHFIRLNGWPGLLKRNIAEASCTSDELKQQAEKVFFLFGKTTEWVPDVPGFVTARVISMIINEAYFTLEENVSTKEEIDTAMKLGTNYPYGPFEWGKVIGLKNIYGLLKKLSETNARYTPAALLEKEALAL